MEKVTLTITKDQQQILINILSAVNNNRRFQKGSNLRESFVFDLDQNDIDTMMIFTNEANWKQETEETAGSEITQRLDQIQSLTLLAAKEALNVEDVHLLTGLAKQTIYNLVHKREIPCYKKDGHNVRFKKTEINEWFLQNRQSTVAELDAKAALLTVTKHANFHAF